MGEAKVKTDDFGASVYEKDKQDVSGQAYKKIMAYRYNYLPWKGDPIAHEFKYIDNLMRADDNESYLVSNKKSGKGK